MNGKLRTEWVVERLQELGRRHADLAEAVGLSPSKLSRTLGGDRRLQVHEMLSLCNFLQVTVEEAVQRFMGEDAPVDSGGTPQPDANRAAALSEALIEKVALYALRANDQFGGPQSSAQLASTIAKFCTDFQGDTADFTEFERQLEEAIRTAVRFTPKPSLGAEDG